MPVVLCVLATLLATTALLVGLERMLSRLSWRLVVEGPILALFAALAALVVADFASLSESATMLTVDIALAWALVLWFVAAYRVYNQLRARGGKSGDGQ
jgi:hypothetical protein